MLLQEKSDEIMAANKATTHFWTEEETEVMLHQMRELDILKFLDGRRTRNESLYQKLASKMEKVGFIRTPKQIRIKWKNTRAAYTKAKKNKGKSGQNRVTCPHYKLMEELLGRRSVSQAVQCGVDVGGVEEADQKTTEIVEIKEEQEQQEEEEQEQQQEQQQQQLDDDSPESSSSTAMPGTSAQRPRQRRRNPESIAQLCQEVGESRALLLQELRESGEYLRELANHMREIQVDHKRNMAALLEGLNNLRQPAPSPNMQYPCPPRSANYRPVLPGNLVICFSNDLPCTNVAKSEHEEI